MSQPLASPMTVAPRSPADLGPVDLGPVDLGPVDLGPVDLGPVDLGRADPGRTARGPAVLAAAAALLALALRLPALPRQLHDHDSVNFAHALQHFDLARHSPHLPGYPLYLALAKLAWLLGATPEAALAWPALLGAMAAAAALAVWLAPRWGARAALAAAAAYLLLPDLALADARPLSDGLGAHLVTLLALTSLQALQAPRPDLHPKAPDPPRHAPHQPLQGPDLGAATRHGRWAMLLAGALLGVRLSSWPVALGAAAALLWAAPSPRERALRLGLGLAALLAWAVPLVALAGGPVALAELGFHFAQGHFRQWRGDAPPPAALQVAGLWLGHLWHGGALLLLAALAGLLAGRQLSGRRGVGLLLALAGAYALWLGLGQNPERPRHILPLVALLAVALAHGLRRPRALWLLAVPALAAVSLPRLALQRSAPTPDVALGQWLAAQPAEGTLVLGGSEVGVLRWQAPAVRSLRVADPADLRAMLGDPALRAPRLLLTSRLPGLAQLAERGLVLEQVAWFAARPGIDLPRQGLGVYRLRAPQPLAHTETTSEELP